MFFFNYACCEKCLKMSSYSIKTTHIYLYLNSITHLQLLSTITCVNLHVCRRSERKSGRRLRDSRPGPTSLPPKLRPSRPGQPSPRPSATIWVRFDVSSSRCLRWASDCTPGGTQPFRPATVTRIRSLSSRWLRWGHAPRLLRCWSENDGTLLRMSVCMAMLWPADEGALFSVVVLSVSDPEGFWVKKAGGTSQKCSSSTCKEGGSRKQPCKPRRSVCSRQSLCRRGHLEVRPCSHDSVRKAPPRADNSRPRRRRYRRPRPKYWRSRIHSTRDVTC